MSLPENYQSLLNPPQTEVAIKQIKDFFQSSLSSELRLRRVTAPLFVKSGTGINDDLNGIEKPVSFSTPRIGNVEIVQSLAKWKRMMLADLDIPCNYGLYTDMNAIRPDEIPDITHSLYVDQWDWELTLSPEDRTLSRLIKVVTKIYSVLRRTEFFIYEHYPHINPLLPEEITFIHAEELLQLYPMLSPAERENMITREKGAVFIIGIGGPLSDGKPHDHRAPDYDDWSSPTQYPEERRQRNHGTPGRAPFYSGLNGDILLWNPVLKQSFEISSMGIRVDKSALQRQLELTGTTERKKLFWHQRLMNGDFPNSIGGGIGQSRLCMFYLRKAHIGEVQSSLWPEEMLQACHEAGIFLL